MTRSKPWLTALLQLVILLAAVACAAPWLDANERTLPIPRRADDVLLRGRQSRPVFNGSVVPGGVYSLDELRAAIARDPVVAAHYRAMNVDEMHLETLTEGKAAYVSYRAGNRVFWTRNRVYLKAGETILTDGHTTIRARCGNCVSDVPQQALSGVDPARGELDDFVVPPTPDTGTEASTAEAEQNLGDLLSVPFGPQMFAFLAPTWSPAQRLTDETFGSGGSPFFVGPPPVFPGGGGGGGLPPGSPAVFVFGDGGTVPGGSGTGSSGGAKDSGGGTGSPGSDGTGGTTRNDLTDTSDTTDTSTTGATSAPEPEVLWLVGVGLIGVARRRLR